MTLRRDFMAMTAGAVAARTVLPMAAKAGEPHPDAALIAACNEYLRIQQAFEAAFVALPGDMDDDDPAWSLLDPLPAFEEQIVAHRATTSEGHFARSLCVAFTYLPTHPSCQDNPLDPREDRFEAAGMRDMVRLVRGMSV